MKTALSHKETKDKSVLQLRKMYKSIAATGFEKTKDPIYFLSKIYGVNSPITQYTMEILTNRQRQGNCKTLKKYNFLSSEVKDEVMVLCEKYWDSAHGMLVSTDVWNQLDSKMNKFYEIDLEKKVRAVLILQRVVREYLTKHFAFSRRLIEADEANKRAYDMKQAIRNKAILQSKAVRASLVSHEESKPLETKKRKKNRRHPSASNNSSSYTQSIYSTSHTTRKSLMSSELLEVARVDRSLNSLHTQSNFRSDRLIDQKEIIGNESSFITNGGGKIATQSYITLETYNLKQTGESTEVRQRALNQSHELPRPHTAGEAAFRSTEFRNNSSLKRPKTAEKLGIVENRLGNSSNKFGLPKDCFDDVQVNTNGDARLGMKFLRTMSAEKFGGLKFKKRAKSAPRLKQNG